MFLAMEYMPLGDLEQNLREIEKSSAQSKLSISEEEVQEITRQILEGLKIMHAEGFAHRDLKPHNVFVVQRHPQWWVKLGDFGLSKRQTEGTAYRTHAGTQEYMAPELFYYVQEINTETSEYTNAIDLWALGCLVHRLVTGKVPFPNMLTLRNYCIDQLKVTLKMPPIMEEAGNFVRWLLMPHPAKRPTASAALVSTWLTMSKQSSQFAGPLEIA
jgi:serine/threonine protein kinase